MNFFSITHIERVEFNDSKYSNEKKHSTTTTAATPLIRINQSGIRLYAYGILSTFILSTVCALKTVQRTARIYIRMQMEINISERGIGDTEQSICITGWQDLIY